MKLCFFGCDIEFLPWTLIQGSLHQAPTAVSGLSDDISPTPRRCPGAQPTKGRIIYLHPPGQLCSILNAGTLSPLWIFLFLYAAQYSGTENYILMPLQTQPRKRKSPCTEVNDYAKERKCSINDSFDPQTSWEQMHLECRIHGFT